MNEHNLLVYPLNGIEMMKLNPTAKLITYDQLNKVYNIDDLFKDTDKIIILYLLRSRQEGHWVCLFKNKEGYNFFDSYGHKPDYEIDCLTEIQRRDFHEKKHKLHQLLKNKDVVYNNIKLQGKASMVCGCYVSHRLNNSNLTEDEYINKFIK